jgi:hypothetical protein
MATTYLFQTEETEHHLVVADSKYSAQYLLAKCLMELFGDEEGKRLYYASEIITEWENVNGCKLTFYTEHCICTASL